MLRRGSQKWPPIFTTKKQARVGYGKYKCAACKKIVPPTYKEGKTRKPNIFVDHIEPVIAPETGFVDWNIYIDRLFCSPKNLQLLCKECHDKKTASENARRKYER